jgi:hypothetical protein
MQTSGGVTTCGPALVLLLVAACASDEAARYYGEEKYAPKQPEDVELLTASPKRPHKVIADFQARGASPKTMRAKAAAIGADAVIITTFGGYRSKADEWASSDSESTSYSRIAATAIKYTN